MRSSMNDRPHMMMLALAIASLHLASASGFSAKVAQACSVSVRPGIASRSLVCARRSRGLRSGGRA
jgi:hypothetical protein